MILILQFHRIDSDIKHYLLLTFLIPFETVETRRVNKIFSNTFGKAIGYFFIWISHYIYWLIFPSILGLIIHLLFFFKSQKDSNTFDLILSLIFTGTIVIWGNYYILSWKKMYKFYSHMIVLKLQ